jgi:hypothetical protein
MGNMEKSQWSMENKWINYWSMKKISSISLDPLEFVHLLFNHVFLLSVEVDLN